MRTRKRVVGAIILCCAIAATGAQAQTAKPKPAPAEKSEPTLSQTTEDVKTWSRKKWNAAKAEYAKQTTKWADCRKKADAKKLTGRANWSFLYDCMKS
ncbi:MAG TPA: hypothetical protein VH249_17365 [Xanthobacteraceae bacterium]|jgi:hypothetical protein|nr:hypothetical protein [Xanthobacteraceae bacterium]